MINCLIMIFIAHVNQLFDFDFTKKSLKSGFGQQVMQAYINPLPGKKVTALVKQLAFQIT